MNDAGKNTKKVMVFKRRLDDGVSVACEVDEMWNWSGNQIYIQNVIDAIDRQFVPVNFEDLPKVFSGKLFWAEVKNVIEPGKL